MSMISKRAPRGRRSHFHALALFLGLVSCVSPEDAMLLETEQGIMNGVHDKDSKYPWVVHVSSRLDCHGTLISPEWVLTAAHCVGYGGATVDYKRTSPTGISTSGSRQVDHTQVHVHPDYAAGDSDNDIALLKLSSAFAPDPLLQPAELAVRPPKLQELGLVASTRTHTAPLIPADSVSTYTAPFIISTAFATYTTSTESTNPNLRLCVGDSGSGVIQRLAGRVFVVAVASESNCNDGGLAEAHHSSVYYHRDWILRKTGASPRQPNGRADILFRDGTKLTSWMMKPDAGIDYYADIEPVATEWQYLGAGDFNNDSMDDILWRHSSTGGVVIWQMNGGVVTSYHNHGAMAANWRFAGVGDINRDGRSDVIWHDQTTGAVRAWEMLGSGQIGFVNNIGVASDGWVLLGLADFDGDGDDDILFRKYTGLAIWQMQVSYAWDSQVQQYVNPPFMSSDWAFAGLAKANTDGTADIYWRNTTTGNVRIWLMNRASVSGVHDPSTATSDWSLKAVTDITGDGIGDIVWRNSRSGNVAVWVMGATGAVTSYANPGNASLNWSLIGTGNLD